jgi:hypothetical protein
VNLFFNRILYFILIGVITVYSNFLSAQNISGFQYINPLPNSEYVSTNSNIIIRQGADISRPSINDNLVEVNGSKSGVHTGRLILAADSRTLLFTPSYPFQTDEEITVTLKNGLKTTTGQDAGQVTFEFHTCENANTLVPENKSIPKRTAGVPQKPQSGFIPDTALPSDLPMVNINISDNPSPGYLFLEASPYLEIIDNEGTPVYFQNVDGDIYDFNLQPDSELTYFVYPVSCYGMNNSLNQVRTFITTNGYTPDVHDLRVLPDGGYYIFGKRDVKMDMSKIVPGGNRNADIIEGALQEYDAKGNLIFQWDALDHYKITDVNSNVDLTQSTIDFSHFNSVEIDTDGNLLISARNLDEITKVDHNTGNIIWRWGGKNNQFTFINDNLGFSQQHDIRRFSNGDYSLFDNGVYHTQAISSAVEYSLDQINMTATLVRRIYHENIYTVTEGNVEELPNGNRLICWGQNYSPFVSEITPDNKTVFEMSYSYYIDTYRTYKYQWKTDLFTTSTDSINFGDFTGGTPIEKQFTVYNPGDTLVTINEFYCSNPSISTNVILPVTIKPGDSLVVPITFTPANDSNFTVSFNIRDIQTTYGHSKMIARQVILSGTNETVSSVDNSNDIPKQYELDQNYPNPFNPTTIINYQLPADGIVSLKVYDMLGREIQTLVNRYQNRGSYNVSFDGSNLSSGVYFYQIRISSENANNFSSTRKMLLVK